MLIRRKYSMNGLLLREDFFNSQLYTKIHRDRVIAWDKFALVHSRPSGRIPFSMVRSIEVGLQYSDQSIY